MWLLVVAALSALTVASPPVSLTTSVGDVSLECSICQLFAFAGAARNGVPTSGSFAHCSRFGGCSRALTDCQIVSVLYPALTAERGKFNNFKPILENAQQKCAIDSKFSFLGSDITTNTTALQCQLCILIYDTLEYFNTGIWQSPIFGDIINALNAACFFINHDFCDLLDNGALTAIVKGIQDSLGSFYDLIAVQGFGCKPYEQLFGYCPDT